MTISNSNTPPSPSARLCGLQKTTLLDYPGHIAATVFLGGCNFRCPFCHNWGIIGKDAPTTMTVHDLMAFLKKRRSVLEGVCISGGEPTMDPRALKDLLSQIKALGYLIKLDTNGSNPLLLDQLWQDGLIDYVAMDIKAGLQHYSQACGLNNPCLDSIKQSAAWLMENHVSYEFRTTVVKGLHTVDDLRSIAGWLEGPSFYFLQSFLASEQVPNQRFTSFSGEEMEYFLSIIRQKLPNAAIRGV